MRSFIRRLLIRWLGIDVRRVRNVPDVRGFIKTGRLTSFSMSAPMSGSLAPPCAGKEMGARLSRSRAHPVRISRTRRESGSGW